MQRKWMSFIILLVFLTAAASSRAGMTRAQDEIPTPRPLANPDAPDGEQDGSLAPVSPTACSVPVTATVRGKSVDFDQCYENSFTHNSTTYEVHVFYTEQDTANNLSQCDASDAVGRCEHKISDNDNGSGDNINAVEMADEAELALKFYLDRNLDMISGTTLNVYLAEDPRGGGIINPSSLYADDELVDNTDDLWKRLLAFHEGQHLVQDKYDNGGVGWKSFYGEGIARAIEDRADTTMDSDTGHLFIPEVNGILGSNTNRTDDISTISYRSVLWWTWLMDQYSSPSDTNPVIGWAALRDFYLELNSESDQIKAISDYISSEGSSFRDDFIDYTLSLYAYDLNPADSRLTYLDNEILNNSNGLSGHTIINSGPAFGNVSLSMNPRSSRYLEFTPASQCDFISFTFDGNGSPYGFSVMTADGGALQKRWTSYSTGWARTVRSTDLDSVVGVVSAFTNSGTVDVGRGCVSPSLNIKNPTTTLFDMVGNADSPRNFIVRLDVDGEDGSGVAGLVSSDFTVQLQKSGGGPLLTTTVINATYVQDDYWLLVAPPTDVDGAENGQFYDLIVSLGSQSDSELSSVLYVKRTQDLAIVLDRSGSMSFASGKIQAARNAAALLVNELADDDQGAYVAFDTDATLREPLAQVGSGAGSHREDLESAIAAEVPLNFTSIGDGLNTAASEHDANGIAANLCSFVLLSDGYENEPAFWADVQANVVDNGCAIHSIALGPETNELLMQQIAAAVPGGSYDYADVSGSVPILGPASSLSPAAASLGWENNISRVYDAKATHIAGRQRLQTAQSLGPDNERFQEYRFFVDDSMDELVIAVAWQNPTKGEQIIELYDPDGNKVTPDSQRFSQIFKTNEVLRLLKPKEGYWSLRVAQLNQEYFVSVSGLTDYEMYLFVGTPINSLSQGVKVPLLVTFVGQGKPLLGAQVVTTVRAPNGVLTNVTLFDDGNHGDSEPDDGIYGGFYTATSQADANPTGPVNENEEPAILGSYLVNAVGVKGDIRREAQGSFAIETGEDKNQNRLPDAWEATHGVSDPGGDEDGDKLTNYCEFQLGTDPRNPDTDGGGESDGSEVPGCQLIGQEPLDPSDDRVGPILSVVAIPDLDRLSRPIVVLQWGNPLRGQLSYVNIFRRLLGGSGLAGPLADWEQIASDQQGNSYDDGNVKPGNSYEYRIEPVITMGGGGTATGAMLSSNSVTPSDDPHPPGGTVLINDGNPTTTSRLVTLMLTADDLYGETDGGLAPEPVGSLVAQLDMRLSNSPDFSGAGWQPFQAEVLNWDLGALQAGEVGTVYVQFRDEAGNVSESGFGLSASIIYQPFQIFLPVVIR